ncbi:receptor-transporting protein 3-like [Elgaria multicarinata webbii]|uniref:receptor-transporting protein 3-like n=1 Tax=Elgaria multicarinata webbii TaxID=159646 RepID=UPI002FCD48BE
MPNWRTEFIRKMEAYKPWDQWNLTEEMELRQLQQGWQRFIQKQLFARFKCSNCSHSWKSAQVTIVFHMQLLQTILGQALGQVKMRVFGQKCRVCHSKKYAAPTFSDEMVQCVLHNLVQKILEKCYGKGNRFDPLCRPVAEGVVEGPHDKDNCEACEHGVCLAQAAPAFRGQPLQWEGSFVRPTSSVQPTEAERSWWTCCKILVFLLLVTAGFIVIRFALIQGK